MEGRSDHRSRQVCDSYSYTIKGLEPDSCRTCLRILIMGITKRPVLNPPTPQREFDLATLSPDLLDEISGSFSVPSIDSGESHLAIKSVAPGAPLRSHLYPMAGSLPESHLPHPLTLLPEMTASAMTSEILTSTATLVHLLLLLRAQVCFSLVMYPSPQNVARPR